jgi:hypothetical protein
MVHPLKIVPGPAFSARFPCRDLRKRRDRGGIGKIHAYRRGVEKLGVIPLKTLGMIFGAALVVTGQAAADTLKLRCANVASGASWDIAVDLDHHRVGDLAAEIDGGSITWRDPENRTYKLDRATGILKMRNASSTGGYFLYYTCRPE